MMSMFSARFRSRVIRYTNPAIKKLVDERVFVSVQFQHDGAAGDIAWVDTVSGRRGEALFATSADSVLQVEMPGGTRYVYVAGGNLMCITDDGKVWAVQNFR